MMIKTKDGYASISKLIGNERQITLTIPNKDWKYFNLGDRVKIVAPNKKEIYKRVRAIGAGKQRSITIPREEWELFKIGDKVLIYPEKQPKIVSKSQGSMDKHEKNEQIRPPNNLQ